MSHIKRVASRAMAAVAVTYLLHGPSTAGPVDPASGGLPTPCAPPSGGGTGTERINTARWAEAERLRIERERPCTRAFLRAVALRMAGRFNEALVEAERLADLASQLHSSFQWQDGLELQGRILVDLGRYAEALPLLVEGTRTGGDPVSMTDLALCRLKTGDLKGARTHDVQSRLTGLFSTMPPTALPGVSTPVQLEASLWLDRAQSTEGPFLQSQWAIRAARLSPTCVAANWVAAHALGSLGQQASARKYLVKAAAGTPCVLQAEARNRLGWRKAEECKDRFPQGTVPPPPGEGIDPVPDP